MQSVLATQRIMATSTEKRDLLLDRRRSHR
jgi:hypothetical protein